MFDNVVNMLLQYFEAGSRNQFISNLLIDQSSNKVPYRTYILILKAIKVPHSI